MQIHTHRHTHTHIFTLIHTDTDTHMHNTHIYKTQHSQHTYTHTFADTHIHNTTHTYTAFTDRHSDADTNITHTHTQTCSHTHTHTLIHTDTLSHKQTHTYAYNTQTHTNTHAPMQQHQTTLEGWAGSWLSHVKKGRHRLRPAQKQMGRQRMFLDKYKRNASPGLGAGVTSCGADLQGRVLPGLGVYKDVQLEYLQGCRQSPAGWSQLPPWAVSADK